jgi:hypothetical protein
MPVRLPASAEVVDELQQAGFVDIRFETLSKTVNVHDWQVLSKSAASASFLFLEPEKVSASA